MAVDDHALDQVAMTRDEYERLLDMLDRLNATLPPAMRSAEEAA